MFLKFFIVNTDNNLEKFPSKSNKLKFNFLFVSNVIETTKSCVNGSFDFSKKLLTISCIFPHHHLRKHHGTVQPPPLSLFTGSDNVIYQ